MKRLTSLLPLLGLLTLAACSNSSGGTGGRPPLPTGVEVRFPAAPASAYLTLLTDSSTSVYQVTVPAGKTSIEVDPTKWKAQSEHAPNIESLIPDGNIPNTVNIDNWGVKVLWLHWVMWQDKNTNGMRDAGEDLNLMTHDRVTYSNKDVNVSFKTTTPNMQQYWTFKAGWTRSEHYVFLPLESTTYQRHLETNTLQRYTLHVPTPITSQ